MCGTRVCFNDRDLKFLKLNFSDEGGGVKIFWHLSWTQESKLEASQGVDSLYSCVLQI